MTHFNLPLTKHGIAARATKPCHVKPEYTATVYISRETTHSLHKYGATGAPSWSQAQL